MNAFGCVAMQVLCIRLQAAKSTGVVRAQCLEHPAYLMSQTKPLKTKRFLLKRENKGECTGDNCKGGLFEAKTEMFLW
jgi:hypothetical protein